MNQPRLQLAFLTGPVNPRSAALDPQQNGFLGSLHARLVAATVSAPALNRSATASPLPAGDLPNTTVNAFEIKLVACDFPYPRESTPWSPTPLWLACLRNLSHFARARTTAFARAHRASVEHLVAQADCTVFFAGSCGLELLAGLALDADILARIRVIAYGPVAWRPLPSVKYVTIRGRSDPLSAAFFPETDFLVPGAHLDTIERPEFATLCLHLISHTLNLSPPLRLRRHAATL